MMDPPDAEREVSNPALYLIPVTPPPKWLVGCYNPLASKSVCSTEASAKKKKKKKKKKKEQLRVHILFYVSALLFLANADLAGIRDGLTNGVTVLLVR